MCAIEKEQRERTIESCLSDTERYLEFVGTGKPTQNELDANRDNKFEASRFSCNSCESCPWVHGRFSDYFDTESSQDSARAYNASVT